MKISRLKKKICDKISKKLIVFDLNRGHLTEIEKKYIFFICFFYVQTQKSNHVVDSSLCRSLLIYLYLKILTIHILLRIHRPYDKFRILGNIPFNFYFLFFRRKSLFPKSLHAVPIKKILHMKVKILYYLFFL